MAYTNPSVADFKAYFFRDFKYGTDLNTDVLDQDITSAFLSTNFNIAPDLFQDQGGYNLGYNLLSAHYLVMNLRTSSQGLNGQYNFLETSKGAGPVTEAFQIPDRIMADPYWSMLTKTNYGAQYLFLILPQMAGAVYNAYGTTRP